MATLKIKKGDTVRVIAGKDKGKEGKVVSASNGKVLVEGVNTVTKHTKASQATHRAASFIRRLQSMLPTLCTFTRARQPESVSQRLRVRTVLRRYVLQRKPVKLSTNSWRGGLSS